MVMQCVHFVAKESRERKELNYTPACSHTATARNERWSKFERKFQRRTCFMILLPLQPTVLEVFFPTLAQDVHLT